GAPRLWASDDGGESWTAKDVTPADAPSGQDVWDRDVTMSIESTGSQTLAEVTTTYWVDGKKLFPEMASPDGNVYDVQPGADGVTLLRYDTDGTIAGRVAGAPVPPVPDTSAPTTTVPADGSTPPSTEPVWMRPGSTVVKTVPWSALGVSGQDAVGSRHQF